jgi:hypothetical protein
MNKSLNNYRLLTNLNFKLSFDKLSYHLHPPTGGVSYGVALGRNCNENAFVEKF